MAPKVKRSYTGCLTCKSRKLKCDETKPSCRHCAKASRECTYGDQHIFLNQPIHSMRRRKRKDRGNVQPDKSPAFEEGQKWLDLPSELTFVQIEDPWTLDNTGVEQSPDSAPRREDDADHHDHNSGMEIGEEANLPVHDTTSGLVSMHGSPMSYLPSLHTPLETASPAYSDSADDYEHDTLNKVVISYLIRHFKEGPGQWMDLFDTTAYFSSKVPILTATKPLLKSAVCALSAKHLRHICYTATQAEESPNSSSNYSKLPLQNEDTWQYHSAKQYDQALRRLKIAIDMEAYDINPSDKEEMLAAVAILCAFELMDAPGSAWRAHLSALPLFSKRDISSTDLSTLVIPQTAIKGPIFWSLARQDLLCACKVQDNLAKLAIIQTDSRYLVISETQTRLDLKDMRLWQNAGLLTDKDGSLLPSTPQSVLDIRNSTAFEEDTKANELTWILGKIANHLTAGDALNPEENALPRGQRSSIGLTQEHLSDRWKLLMGELTSWYDSLPPIFRVTGRTRELGQPNAWLLLSFRTFEQIWFDLPICAATLQSYHQAKILMCTNEPQESTAIRSTVSSRLRSYRRALDEAIYHARQICGISLANLTDSVRINSVQALFVAGQVLEERQEQEAVIELLVGIERDLGWTTRYHVAKLKDEWARDRSDQRADRV